MYKYSWVHSSSFQWTLVFHFTLEQQVKLTCSFALNGYTLATLAPGIQKVDKIITINWIISQYYWFP